MVDLAVGDRVFNGGDVRNHEHFGTITAEKKGNYGHDFQITPDEDSGDDCEPYWIAAYTVQDIYKGHGGTRIVTEAAYKVWREERIAALRQNF